MDDASLQAEEFESLEAIYAEDIVLEAASSRVCEVHIPCCSPGEPHLTMRALLPADYPSQSAPLVELQAAHISPDLLAAASCELEALFVPGEVCLFQYAEWLKARYEEWMDAAQAAEAADAKASEADEAASLGEQVAQCSLQAAADEDGEEDASPSEEQDAIMAEMAPKITSGAPQTINKSTFQAHVAPVTSIEEVKAVVACLLLNKKIRAATHNMMAYRFPVDGKPGCYHQDFDDDGEAAAGGRLLHMLQVAGVEGVVVVVSRWFGGVLLGPARFSLINNTARDLLVETGYLKQGGQAAAPSKGKAGRKG